jgi:hypothetical protein
LFLNEWNRSIIKGDRMDNVAVWQCGSVAWQWLQWQWQWMGGSGSGSGWGWWWFLNEWNRSSIEGVRMDNVAVWLGGSVAWQWLQWQWLQWQWLGVAVAVAVVFE